MPSSRSPQHTRRFRVRRTVGAVAGATILGVVVYAGVEALTSGGAGGGATGADLAAGTTGSGSTARAPSTTALGQPGGASPSPPGPLRVAVRRIGLLPSALQDAAATTVNGAVLAAGGLDAADLSTSAIRRIDGSGAASVIGRLPVATHDAGAATVGGRAYLFGGGDGVAQHGEIRELRPSGPRTVGRLPALASDLAVASAGASAFIVGGYDGRRSLGTVLGWRPGQPVRVVARLPTPLRYAAVTAVGTTLVVAGGTRPDGSATSAVLAIDTTTGRVRVLGHLPQATTHAAAATLAGRAVVIGGRGQAPGTPTRRILAVDPVRGTIRAIGALVRPLSDASAATVGGRIFVVGGRDRSGARREILSIALAGRTRASASAPAAARRATPNIYAHATASAAALAPEARLALPRVYVPNSGSNTVDVIDPRTYRVVASFPVGAQPQHVTPSWDLKTLWVDNDRGNSLTPIDPRTGKAGRPISVHDPYNLYFTPDGRSAIVVAEADGRLDFRDPHNLRIQVSVPVPCRGVDHMDFSVDGATSLASCEFSGSLVVVDLKGHRVVRQIRLPRRRGHPTPMPQDVKLSPDGSTYYVADMASDGIWSIRARDFRIEGFTPTGKGAHGLYPSRDARFLYVSNRDAGSISVFSFARRRVVATWRIPGGGSPDMGGVSADGRTLWLSGRYSSAVYAIDTRTGVVRARIRVGSGPHGLCVWPQPGRYSLGHTGILR